MKKVLILGLLALTSLFASEEKKVKVDFGGYGELHLNKKMYEDTTVAKEAAKFDFHRFVAFLGLEFGEKWSFLSEIELEHNKVEVGQDSESKKVNKSGYLILEQAYLQYAASEAVQFRAGVMLYPMGLINEYHEPTTFSTVERPLYHKYVIPTTWFGTGIAVGGNLAKGALRYDVLVTEGLDDKKFSKGIRNGRQKGFYSSLENVFGVARLDFTGLPGLKIGGSFGLNENLYDENNDHDYDRTVIAEGHIQYTGNGFRTSAEFANISYSAIEGRDGDLENTQGFTADLGYDIARIWNAEKMALYPYTRYTLMNRSGKLGDDGAFSRLDGGIAFNPIKNVTLKLSAAREMYDGRDNDKFFLDAGFGYVF